MRALVGAALLAVLSSAPAYAETDLEFAHKVATILSAETFCDFSYDAAGVAAFIEEKVDASNYSFPNDVASAGALTRQYERKMGPAQKTAHCTQIRRIAEHYGFIK